ncbi:Activating signal cointegrator 1 complex subunit 3 [Acipenser ruthenus]|uniref:Activating signal cointegrator 1 complex subunit 3 n=1 Tax=Acipenser ruthenus TaxID=7906 RepID=A0A662YUB2_ACIRT|nr:Activating signal cointegrator 1 complex subunit 3 [Acipenser ruthenus]
MIESAAVFLFTTFYAKDQLGQEETRTIKQMFGPFPSSSASAACNAVNRVTSVFDETQLETFIKTHSANCLKDQVPFGKNITFSFDLYALDHLEDLPLNIDDEKGSKEFSLDYDKFVNNQQEHLRNGSFDKDCPRSSGNTDGSLLRREVEKYLLEGTLGSTTAEDLCTTLFESLASTKSDDELQNELFELLGPEGFELIEKLLQQRSSIVESSLATVPDLKLNYLQEGFELIEKLLQQRSSIVESSLATVPDLKLNYLQDASRKASGESSVPIYGCQVTIQSEQEKQLMKQFRREEKRIAKREKRWDDSEGDTPMHFDPKELRIQREHALLTAQKSPVLGRQKTYEKIHYPNVYDCCAEAMKTSAFIGGSKLLLPEGIKRENTKMYEEVTIPPNEPMPVGFEEKPVYITDLDEIGQLVFKGMKRLNRIQSIVFETAYNTNENMLICAPTGAGKTNIAMLTVVHEIRQHIQQGVIKKDEFKIVYVAPMKALAAEMTNYFSKRLEPLGITVKELTGDMQLTKGEILRTQMLVTTPEKWDVVTRKSVGDVALSQIVRLIILDEVHLLHEDRGPVLESLVARTLRQVESTQSMIRILGLSATLPNYLDVATFLHVNPYIGLFYFDSRFRPVPLGQTFVGIKTTNKVMVFVHARNSTVRTAMALIEIAKNRGESSFFFADQGAEYGHLEKQTTVDICGALIEWTSVDCKSHLVVFLLC